jgi:predicted XRE-type DNA-binding protein
VNDDNALIRGSGNVFRDFGHPNADLEQARAILAAKIIGVLDTRGLTARATERLTGIAAADISRIRNARLARFTLDRLIIILGKLAEEVEVGLVVRPRHRKGHTLQQRP